MQCLNMKKGLRKGSASSLILHLMSIIIFTDHHLTIIMVILSYSCFDSRLSSKHLNYASAYVLQAIKEICELS